MTHFAYEWNRSHRTFSNFRVFHQNPIVKALEFTATISPVNQQSVTVTYHGTVYGKNVLIKLIAPIMKSGFNKGVAFSANITEYILNEKFITDPMKNPRILMNLRLLDSSNVAKLLAHYIDRSDDYELHRINTKKLALFLRVDHQELLTLFLKGARAGYFKLNYDLICPSCKGAKQQVGTLKDFSSNQKIHCSSCHIAYNTDFDRNVEVTFSPLSPLREIQGKSYCGAMPTNTKHIQLQAVLIPNRMHTDEFVFSQLHPYYIRSPQCPNRRWVVQPVEEGEGLTDTIEVVFDPASSLLGGTSQEDENATIMETFTVKQNSPITIRMLNKDARCFIVGQIHFVQSYAETVLTAFEIVNTPSFRQYFADDVLNANETVRVKEVTLLFTDLKSSTSMYQEHGDVKAFAAVVDHFKILINATNANNGVVIKSIGDAIMSSFRVPEDGIRAAIQMQSDIIALNAKHEVDIVLKVGAHVGQTMLVNLNNRLDYFGNNVNMAARTEGCCDGNDIVVSGDMFQSVRSFLEQEERIGAIKITPFKKLLKGFSGESDLYRITFPSL